MRADRQRLDKWLWFARFARSRDLACRHVADGRVRLNGTRVADHAQAIKLGDVLPLALPHAPLVVKVADLGTRRGDVSQAAKLFQDMTLAQNDPISTADPVGAEKQR
ncbi:MAG: S4 domain-containing protein [Bosea sp. (in: a-proteobacteria)]